VSFPLLKSVIYKRTSVAGGRGRGGGQRCVCLGRQSLRGGQAGGKMNILNEKFYFTRSTIFKRFQFIKVRNFFQWAAILTTRFRRHIT